MSTTKSKIKDHADLMRVDGAVVNVDSKAYQMRLQQIKRQEEIDRLKEESILWKEKYDVMEKELSEIKEMLMKLIESTAQNTL